MATLGGHKQMSLGALGRAVSAVPSFGLCSGPGFFRAFPWAAQPPQPHLTLPALHLRVPPPPSPNFGHPQPRAPSPECRPFKLAVILLGCRPASSRLPVQTWGGQGAHPPACARDDLVLQTPGKWHRPLTPPLPRVNQRCCRGRSSQAPDEAAGA